MAISYGPVFLWIPRRLDTGQWAWLRTVRLDRHGGRHTYSLYLKL